jgi:hypothetical protein
MKTELTPTQAAVLQLAACCPDGRLNPLPQNLPGAARDSVIRGPLSRALITKCDYPGHVEYHHTTAGLAVGGSLAIDSSDSIAGQGKVGISNHLPTLRNGVQ